MSCALNDIHMHTRIRAVSFFLKKKRNKKDDCGMTWTLESEFIRPTDVHDPSIVAQDLPSQSRLREPSRRRAQEGIDTLPLLGLLGLAVSQLGESAALCPSTALPKKVLADSCMKNGACPQVLQS